MGMKKGISLIELMAVAAIVAILALIAVPALARITPYAELRGDARHVATLMRQARLKAANSHKPVRVVVDCSQGNACVTRSYIAEFAAPANVNQLGDSFTGWVDMSAGGDPYNLARTVTVSTASQGNTWEGKDLSGAGAGIFWAVFLPSSRMIASHKPFVLTFGSNRVAATRTLRVDGVTGRTSVD